MTGLFNARAYYSLCDRALLQARRAEMPLTMIFIDLDYFKRINDTHGHEAGDTALKAVAACLLEGARQSDIIGRIGGEEFSVLLPDTDLEGARQLGREVAPRHRIPHARHRQHMPSNHRQYRCRRSQTAPTDRRGSSTSSG
ncbi:hypothetical protein MCP1_40004 [Candidatus Terasakiella magnetica]|nr:hypothetical protein MCP1_40004 [Candidatus Terasakiella magnetica]